MSDDPSRAGSRLQDPAHEARAIEAAAIRRRWITLGEILAVLAVLISALTLWNSWSERHDSDAAKTSEAAKASTRAATLVLTASASADDELSLRPASPGQSVQSQTIAFPSALGIAPVTTTGEPRIEAGWFEDALKKARNRAKLPDDSRGDEKLPVAITTQFLVDGEAHQTVAIYDIGYSISGRWLSGHHVTLRGLSLISRLAKGSGVSQIDARWKKLVPSA